MFTIRPARSTRPRSALAAVRLVRLVTRSTDATFHGMRAVVLTVQPLRRSMTAVRRASAGRTASRGRIHCPRRPASRGTLRFLHRQAADAGAERRAFPVESLEPQAPRLAHRQSAPPRLARRGAAGSSPSWLRAPAGRTTVGRPRPDPGKPRSSPGSQREARHQTHPTNQTPAGSEGRRTRARPSKTPQRLVDSRSRKSPAPASRSPSTQSRTEHPLAVSTRHNVAMDALDAQGSSRRSRRHLWLGSA